MSGAPTRRRSAPGDPLRERPLDDLFTEYRRTGDRRLRNVLVEAHAHLADYHARRYATGRAPREDLHQVALMAIVFAVERFDPSLGVAFSTFAGRTIEGECKRYLRDRTWTVRPPRRAQELHLRLRSVEEELTHRLGRSPTVGELAAACSCTEEALLEAMEAGAAYRMASLDQPDRDEPGGGGEPAADLGCTEAGYRRVDHRAIVEEVLEGLSPRDREIVELRFFALLSQPEIASRFGVSQSYLSRMLRRILGQLRDGLDDEAAPGDG